MTLAEKGEGEMTAWDKVRRQARLYEKDLEKEVDSFSRFERISDREDLELNETEGAEKRINDLLLKLTESVETLEGLEESKTASHRAQIKRLKEILFNSKADFIRTQRLRNEKREKEELLREMKQVEAKRDRTNEELLMNERFSLANSQNATDSLLEQASNGLGALRRQRQTFGSAANRLTSMGSQFPGVDQLMKRIKDKKTRDNTILAIVIACCISVITIYELHSWGL